MAAVGIQWDGDFCVTAVFAWLRLAFIQWKHPSLPKNGIALDYICREALKQDKPHTLHITDFLVKFWKVWNKNDARGVIKGSGREEKWW